MADLSPSSSPLSTPEAADYSPSAADLALVSLVEGAFARGRQLRRPHEPQWFVNHAFDRGNHYVVWAEGRGLVTPPAPSHRVRLTVNLVGPINRARASKFLKARPIPLVVPATSEVKDRQNARFTSKALEYQTRRLRLEQKYDTAVRTAQLMGHGYWWFHWNPDVIAKVKIKDPATGESLVEEMKGGDIELEEDSPWSLMVGDAACNYIGNQPWILRLKMRDLAWVRTRFPKRGKYVAGEAGHEDALRYEEQVSTLNTQGLGGSGLSEARETKAPEGKEGQKTQVLVKEYFERPCPEYPKGRYMVVAGGVLLKSQEELPYGFYNFPNPYPVVDFPDLPRTGQYWIPTICEQLIPVQKEYNLLRSKLAEHMRLLVHPKVLIAKQHQVPPGAWTAEAGEVIEYFAVPHLPPPQVVTPAPIAADAWKCFELLRKELSDIAHVYPESEGQVGKSTSGFQTNLLQEAVDAVHKPDVEAHGRVLEEAYYKIRRLMKIGYTVDRLLSVSGKDLEPEAMEFGADNIDDYADIVMIAASALPSLPSARSQMILEFWKAGVYGMADDPEALRKVRTALEQGTVDDLYSEARTDETQAQVENALFLEGGVLPVPEFYENHDRHYAVHTQLLKSPRQWDSEQKRALVAHLLLHVKFQNPQSAIALAQQYGMPDLVADLLGTGPGPQPVTMAPPQAPPAPAPFGAAAGPLPPALPGGGAGPLDFPRRSPSARSWCAWPTPELSMRPQMWPGARPTLS
ncbi:MAG TPA: hypothetical protein VEI97_05290, partial [bacterium]|nr:hypothetical protein [bacterium]